MMTKSKSQRIMARKAKIIRDYQKGVKLDDIMKRYGMPHKKFIYKCLGDLPRRTRLVSEEKRQAILEAVGGSVRSLARRFGVSKTTIHRIRTSGFDKWREEDEVETVTFVPHTWRCPDHGRVTMSPCPICAARGVTQRPAEFMPASTGVRKFRTILTAQ